MNDSKKDVIGDLVVAFPRLFKKARPPVHSWLHDGWVPLVRQLFTDIDGVLTDGEAEQFRVIQVKEKFGALRVYWSLGNEETMVMDLFSENGRITIEQGPEAPTTAYKGLQKLVREATQLSLKTCDECGAPGRLLNDGGWRRTRCEAHTPSGAKVALGEPKDGGAP